jgi:uracil-DNA glycosylase family 4
VAVRTKPSSCEGCACHSHGTDFSRVEGTGSLGVMVVAEASGEMEARDQLPLRPYAPAGSLLERTFRRMGYSREQFSLTNTLRCRPRNNWLSGAPWEFAALNKCRPNLDAAIAERRPRAILALGDTATRELTGEAGEARGVSHLAGYVLPTYNNNKLDADQPWQIPVIPTFHPAFIRRGKALLQGVFARNLQRAVNVAAGRDREWLWGVDPERKETYGTLDYQTHPSLDQARSFAIRLRENQGACISYDLETFESASLDEDARDGFADTRIRLFQATSQIGSAIALPWEGRYREIAQQILHNPSVKCGHNLWLFDNKVLDAAGAREGIDLRVAGPVHDTLQMFHHWQPDLPAHLQFAAQFVSFPFPWKHLAATALEFYGCVDVDATLRLYMFLRAALEKDGLWNDQSYYRVSGSPIPTSVRSANGNGPTGTDPAGIQSTAPVSSVETPIIGKSDVHGYVGQVAEVRPILAAMERRGLPVDDVERLKLDGEFDLAQQELDAELQKRVPEEVLGLEPRRGKKGNYDYGYIKTPKDIGGLMLRTFTIAGVDESTGEPCGVSVERYCRVIPFNANSAQQLIAYMRAKGHKVPKSREQDDEGRDKDTTAKKELVRLAHRSGDDFYLRVIEYRELSKARGTYIEGFKPHTDGRVHTSFTFDTGTGQLSSRAPNIQNFMKHGRLAKATRRMIAAPSGQILVEWDYKAYHVLTTGYCAEDASYMRMARLDMHSFVAGCFTGAWKPEVMEEPDDALLDRFRWFKADGDRKRIRDKQAKPTILGVGFGMGARRLYQENLEHFPSEKTAKQFLDLLGRLFPCVFDWQRHIRQLAHDQQFLRSPFGHQRRFYEVFVWDYKSSSYKNGDQAEEAVAFLPANIAFGNIRETMKELERRGIAERYGLCNTIHDSFVFCFDASALDRHVEEVYPVLTARSAVLRNSVAPDGLWCDAECSAGVNWSEMSERKVDHGMALVAG